MSDSNGVDDPGASDDAAAEDIDPGELPREVVDEVERLTRLERTATDPDEADAYDERRERLLGDHEFTARVRDDGDATLVLHPEEWHEDGVVRTERIDDLSRAIEIPLEGAADPDDWEAVDERNRALVAAVEEAHGDVHAANATALADFFGNHYAKPIAAATAPELREFRSEYYVRNAWPSKEQRDVVDESIELVLETADASVPGYRDG